MLETNWGQVCESGSGPLGSNPDSNFFLQIRIRTFLSVQYTERNNTTHDHGNFVYLNSNNQFSLTLKILKNFLDPDPVIIFLIKSGSGHKHIKSRNQVKSRHNLFNRDI